MRQEIKDRIEKIRNGEVPEGYKRIEYGMYLNDWKRIRLGDYLVKYNERSLNDEKPPLLTSSRSGLMVQSDYYANREIG